MPDPAAPAAPAVTPVPAAATDTAAVPALAAESAPAAAPDAVEVLSDTTKPVKRAMSTSGILTLAKAYEKTGFSRLAATVTCAFSPAGSVPVPDTDPTSGSVWVPDTEPDSKSAAIVTDAVSPTSLIKQEIDPVDYEASFDSSRYRANFQQGLHAESEESESQQTYEDAKAFWAANYQYEGHIVHGYPKIDPSTGLADYVPVFINFTCSDPSNSIFMAQTEMTNENQFTDECNRLGLTVDQVLRVSNPFPTEQ